MMTACRSPISPLSISALRGVVAVVPPAVGAHVEDDAVALDSVHHGVGVGQRRGEGLLRVDGPGAVVGGVYDYLGAVLGLGGHAHDVGLLLGEHILIVEVLALLRDAVARAEALHHVGPEVGAGDEVGAVRGLVARRVGHWELALGLVVYEAAHPAAPDDHCPVSLHGRPPFGMMAVRAWYSPRV